MEYGLDNGRIQLGSREDEIERERRDRERRQPWLHREHFHAGEPQPEGPATRALRGPKNYVRSDESIRDEICQRMEAAEELDASDIDLQVVDGEVTLSGSVPVRWMKYRAEDLCDRVRGVREIHDLMRVR